jgi:NADPH:quinone reductase-like Zn-dependent oxidoreductase
MREVMWLMVKGRILAPFVKQRELLIVGKVNVDTLSFVANLVEQGKLRPVIDRTYPLTEVPGAVRYLEEGHARGKVIVTINSQSPTSNSQKST